jgi:hypothetical protein
VLLRNHPTCWFYDPRVELLVSSDACLDLSDEPWQATPIVVCGADILPEEKPGTAPHSSYSAQLRGFVEAHQIARALDTNGCEQRQGELGRWLYSVEAREAV